MAVSFYSVSQSYAQPVELLGWGVSPSQGSYLHTEQNKQRIKADTHASSGTQTHDLSVWANKDSSCLSPRSHYDRHGLNPLRLKPRCQWLEIARKTADLYLARCYSSWKKMAPTAILQNGTFLSKWQFNPVIRIMLTAKVSPNYRDPLATEHN
jgi:hypothetical protein